MSSVNVLVTFEGGGSIHIQLNTDAILFTTRESSEPDSPNLVYLKKEFHEQIEEIYKRVEGKIEAIYF